MKVFVFISLLHITAGEYEPHFSYFAPFKSLSKTFKTCKATTCEYECSFKNNKLCSFTGYDEDGYPTSYEGCIRKIHKDKCCSHPDKAEEWIFTENAFQFTCLSKDDKFVDIDGNAKTFEEIKNQEFCSDKENAICRKLEYGGTEDLGPFIHVCQQKTAPCNNKRYINKRTARRLETTTKRTTTERTTTKLSTIPPISITTNTEETTTKVAVPEPLSMLVIVIISLSSIFVILGILILIIFMILRKKKTTAQDFEVIELTESKNIKFTKNEHLLTNIERIINEKLVIKEEFCKVEKFEEENIKENTKIGKAPNNMERNRYLDILPYDSNMVKLKLATVCGKNNASSTYINASFISFPNYIPTFIATQAPRKNMFSAFWQMVLDQKVSTIVMITDLEEGGKIKADQYWPDKDDMVMELDNNINLRYKSHTYPGTYYHRKLVITSAEGKERNIEQIQTTAWMDMTAPESTKILLDLIYAAQDLAKPQKQKKSIKAGQKSGTKDPILVHCSAGVGRTGTFIALYKLISDYHNGPVKELDVFDTVVTMRQQRMKMVQKHQQYIYIFNCLHDYIVAQESVYEE